MARQRDVEKLRAYSKRHYEKNRDAMIAKSKASVLVTREKVRSHIRNHLRDHPCVDCGEDDPIVLEFDHIADRGPKLFEIGSAVRTGVSLKRLVSEIEKCDVRCANCHRRKTYRERGFRHRS